jgi:hypothetical protein
MSERVKAAEGREKSLKSEKNRVEADLHQQM